MLHSVGVAQPNAQAFMRAFDSAIAKAMVHGFVDATDGTIYQTAPWDMLCWHCGGSANNGFIGIEMCESDGIRYKGGAAYDIIDADKARSHFLTAYHSAVELFASLCAEFSLNPMTDIISHAEGHRLGIASGHADPDHLMTAFGYNMDKFRKDVSDEMLTGEEIYKRLNDYCKAQPLPAWAEEEMKEAVEKGITDGSNPCALIPRYQAALLALRAMKGKDK